MTEVIVRLPAMATLFEFVLVGEEEASLNEVAELALQEVERLDLLCSYYNPASELYRLNATSFITPQLCSVDMFEILKQCMHYHHQTAGWFDPCFRSKNSFAGAVQLDTAKRQLKFHHADVQIDLGGFAKGYTLDQVAMILDEYQVIHYFLHSGTSSIRVKGERAPNLPWQVKLAGSCIDPIRLQIEAVSISGDDVTSQPITINPKTKLEVEKGINFVVLSPSAVLSEVWSTAALAMGLSELSILHLPDSIQLGYWRPGTAEFTWQK